jgi:hypothetical protein
MNKLTTACLLALAIVPLAVLPASAQDAKDASACEAGNVAEPDALIAACTAQLASSTEVPRQVETLVARAAAYTKKHQNDRAVADLSRAIALDGSNLAAWKARRTVTTMTINTSAPSRTSTA